MSQFPAEACFCRQALYYGGLPYRGGALSWRVAYETNARNGDGGVCVRVGVGAERRRQLEKSAEYADQPGAEGRLGPAVRWQDTRQVGCDSSLGKGLEGR